MLRPPFEDLTRTNNLFFFSSRRRHTRLQGDWSSDVCSSDLTLDVNDWQTKEVTLIDLEDGTGACADAGTQAQNTQVRGTVPAGTYKGIRMTVGRSEERRVGKECRSRWSPYH